MIVTEFRTEHIDMMRDFGQQDDLLRPIMADLKEARYEDRGPAFSAMEDGRVLGCAGIVPVTPYRAAAWALMSKQDFAQKFIPIHRAVLGFLDSQEYKRIEAQVAYHDKQGHRWMRLLGFRCEVLCRPWFLPDGSAASEYVRFG